MKLPYSVVAIFWTNCVCILKELTEGAAKPRVDFRVIWKTQCQTTAHKGTDTQDGFSSGRGRSRYNIGDEIYVGTAQ